VQDNGNLMRAGYSSGMRLACLILVLLQPARLCAHAMASDARAFDHVLMISVDGLRPECVGETLAHAYPGLARLARGPHTLDARCDPEVSITLPNHVSMVTGRPVTGENGHGWIENTDPPSRKHGGSLSLRKGSDIDSMFDVAHDNGLRTALVVGKWKFVLFEQSYGEDAGDPDQLLPDDGRDKIDSFACTPEPMAIADLAIVSLREATRKGKRGLTMVHFPNADFAGHGEGWDLTEGSLYRKSVTEIDAALQRILAAIDAEPAWRGRVAVVLTADHGGGVPFKSHTDPAAPINFWILFLVWLGADSQPVDLYEINRSSRARPPTAERAVADGPPPIRNADAGNTSLQLLGLPAIPGSVSNARQDLATAVQVPAGGAAKAP
jgi:predicted AlkP superfamily pyrophosphatase or phosphodiesterase